MAVVIVAGQTRGVGKTSVVCGLIAAMPEREWTAVKLSMHGHSVGVEVREETRAGSGKDSERYQAAGAVRSFYISAPPDGLEMLMSRLLAILAEAQDAIVESASVLEYLRPKLALAVVDPAMGEVKESLQRWFERIDAVVVTGGAPLSGALQELEAKPRFVVRPPMYGSEALTAFVREALWK
jgi:hypothetical protein